MKVKRLKLLSPLLILAFVLALVMVAPPLASPAEAATTVLQYDNGTPYDYIERYELCPACSRYQGVRFSLPEGVTSANVTAVRFYYNHTGNATIHITDSDHETDLTDPIYYYVSEAGWCEVDVSGVTVSDDFYVVIRRWEQGRDPAYDDTYNFDRSFYGSSLQDLWTDTMPGNLLIRAVISHGNPIHVYPGPGTPLQDAINDADPGDIIIVHNGTYTENVYVNKSLTIQAVAGKNVTIQAANSNDHVFEVIADYVTISGFTVTGATGMDRAGIYLVGTEHCTIMNNTAESNDSGIRLSSSSNNTISGNTVLGNDECGIWLSWEDSGNTISGNTASGNWAGMYLYKASQNTISDNNASGNDYGIWFTLSSNNTISGNIASGNDYGIYLSLSSGNTIEGNAASDNSYGIILDEWSDNNTFLNNTVHDNGHGIYIVDSSGNLFLGNDISGNTAIEDSGVHLSGDVAGNQFLLNNIVNNTAAGSYGVYNEAADIVNASLNWWGDASGPYHPTANPDGTGDAVSGNVTFEPWLGASVVGVIAEDITGAQTDVEISGPAGSDTTLTVNTTGDVTVIVALYSGNPHPEEPFPDIALGKYIDIYASDPDAILWPVYVEMSYTEDEVAAAGIDESALGLYYWNASANEFQRCSDTGVDTDSNIIWANVDKDEASGLAGTPFATGGAAPGGLSCAAIAGIVIGSCAAAGLIAYFVIRRRRAAG